MHLRVDPTHGEILDQDAATTERPTRIARRIADDDIAMRCPLPVSLIDSRTHISPRRQGSEGNERMLRHTA